MKIAITGIEFFAKRMSKEINRYAPSLEVFFVEPRPKVKTFFNLLKADLIHFIGGNILTSNSIWKSFLLRLLSYNKKILVHWVGSDILRLNTNKYCSNPNLHHACEVEWTQLELVNKGIKAVVLPLIGIDPPVNIPDLPRKFSVLTYMGKGKEPFYGLYEILVLAKELPNIQIRVVGTECSRCKIQDLPENVQFLGWVDNIQDFIASSHVYIRYVKHDGLSISVLEALSLGRYVCYNYPLDGCYYVPTVDKLIEKIKHLQTTFLEDKLNFNFQGLATIRGKYSKNIVYDNLIAFYEELMQ